MTENITEEVHLLLFTIMGVRMGVDLEQIHQMCDPDQISETTGNVSMFHEKVPFRDATAEYQQPKALIIKDEIRPFGIIIDQPEDIISVNLNSIIAIPPLLTSGNKSSVIWAVIIKDKKIILLVDFYRLACPDLNQGN
jgi:chemotaxis signal transduction protein